MPLLPTLLLACSSVAARPVDGVAEPVSERLLDESWRGVSGLDLADGWVAVEERGERLLIEEFQRELRAVPILGLPPGLDLEAVAISEPGLWLGTEGEGRRTEERLLRVLPEGEAARVVEERPLPYAPFGLEGTDNRGVEGLCAAGDHLLAAAEVVATEADRRWAPAWMLQDDDLRPLWLGLSTEDGKLAGLACTTEGEDLLAFGIERHYRVRRILRWRIPPGPPLARLVPEAAWDLDPALPGGPNPEGLALAAQEADGAVLLTIVTDNDHGGLQGPTRLVQVRLAPPEVAR